MASSNRLDIWLYILASASGGLIVGMLGTGSSLILLPMLILIFGSNMPADVSLRLAAGTTMATIAVGAVAGAIAQHRAGNIDTHLFKLTIGPYVLGAFCGPWVSRALPSGLLGGYVAILIGIVAVRMLLAGRNRLPSDRRFVDYRKELCVVLTVIAIGSSIAGVASGIFAIPYLLRFAIPVRTVMGTSTASAAVFASCGALGYVAAGWTAQNLPSGSVGFVYLPAFAVMATVATIATPIGVRLAGRVREDVLRCMFALFLLAAAGAIALTR
jgi:uncharacterized protein